MSKKLVFVEFVQKTVDKEMVIWDATPQNFNSEKHYLSAREKYEKSIVRRIMKEHNSKLEKSKKNEIKTICDIYGNDILKSGKKYPKPWMENDSDFSSMIEKAKYFCDILNYIWETCSYSLTKELQKKVSWKKYHKMETIKTTGKPIRRELILFSVDYEFLSREIDLSISRIKRYLQSFVEYGIIEDIGGGRGTKHPKIYAFGTWIKNEETKNSKKPFITKETHLESLRKFTVTGKPKPTKSDTQKAMVLSIGQYLKND